MAADTSSTRDRVQYPARFIDRFGKSQAVFESDGRDMVLSFRGLTFSTEGHSNIEWLTLQDDPVAAEGKAAVDSEGQLRDGILEVGIPIDAVVRADVRPAVLHMAITFVSGEQWQFMFSLMLDLDGEVYGPAVAYEEFEGALDRLRTMVPEGIRMRVCGTCLLSSNGVHLNYPSGRDCYRATPAEELSARFTGNSKTGRPPRTEDVTDFHVCPQWIPSEVVTWLPPRRDQPVQ